MRLWQMGVVEECCRGTVNNNKARSSNNLVKTYQANTRSRRGLLPRRTRTRSSLFHSVVFFNHRITSLYYPWTLTGILFIAKCTLLAHKNKLSGRCHELYLPSRLPN
jgi:hypothetical protein